MENKTLERVQAASPAEVKHPRKRRPARGGQTDALGSLRALWKRSEPLRLSCLLGGITFVVALLLGIVNAVTAGPIAQHAEQRKQAALTEVFPEADRFAVVDIDLPRSVSEIRSVYAGDELLGYGVSAAANGFGGEIEMLVSVDAQGQVAGISVLKLSETPGVGTNAAAEQQLALYNGKSGTIITEKITHNQPNEVLAVSGATITSKAITEGVNAALEAVRLAGREVS